MTPNIKLIRIKDVIDTTGLARSTIYKYVDKGIFPKTVTLDGRTSLGLKVKCKSGFWQALR
ncbi:helix-turn-helix transcriptional regulator [Shewanella sp. MF08487]|uniref:helix-turn-helix transcriptional regulator n=1 Tax=Shewanella sp. MF08487 TaxID=3434873 RepID=UPI003D7AFF2D